MLWLYLSGKENCTGGSAVCPQSSDGRQYILLLLQTFQGNIFHSCRVIAVDILEKFTLPKHYAPHSKDHAVLKGYCICTGITFFMSWIKWFHVIRRCVLNAWLFSGCTSPVCHIPLCKSSVLLVAICQTPDHKAYGSGGHEDCRAAHWRPVSMFLPQNEGKGHK